jgi:sarcosine oxidase/sarcosine oxidase subunit beta
MPEAFKAYESLFRDLGARHFAPTEIVFVRRQKDDWYATEALKLNALGVPHRELSKTEIADRLPMIRREGVGEVVAFGGAGVLFPREILRDVVTWLTQSGATLHAHSRVEALNPDLGQVTVDGRVHATDVVVVAAGAWASRIAPVLAPLLRPSRQTVLFLGPPEDVRGAWLRAPIIVTDGGAHPGYALPPLNGARLKIGGHHFNRYGDADESRIAIPEEIARVAAVGAEAFSDFERYRILEARANYITSAPEERFVVQKLGRAAWAASACCGHGFKLAPLIAEGVAAAVVNERDAASVATWAAGR